MTAAGIGCLRRIGRICLSNADLSCQDGAPVVETGIWQQYTSVEIESIAGVFEKLQGQQVVIDGGDGEAVSCLTG